LSSQPVKLPPPIPRRLSVRQADYLFSQARPETLIDGILTRGGVAILAAPPYSGKTFLALEAMRAVANRSPFLGHFGVPKHGNVLYFGNDSPAWDIHTQFDKLIGLPDPVTENIPHLLSTTVLGAYGFIFDHTFMLNYPVDAEAIIDAAKRQWSMREYETYGEHEQYRPVSGTDLIVLDTLRSVHGYDENDNTAMQGVMNLLRYIAVSTGAAVLALHHFNKTQKESQQSAMERLRGATAIGGAVDSVFALAGTWPSLAVRVLKNRPFPKQGDFMYAVEESDDHLELRITESGGIVNLAVRKIIMEKLNGVRGWTKTGDLAAAVMVGLGHEKKKAENVVNRVLHVLEKDGTVARIHGGARLASLEVAQ
jgi:hypothetical protein